MSFTTSFGALLGGASREAAVIHQERYQKEQADRKFAFDTLTHIIDDPSIGNPQVKEEALQELHGRLMSTMYPDQFNHKPGKLGKLVDQFIGMQNPEGPMGPMTTAGAGGSMSQPGVGTGNATPTQLGAAQAPPQTQLPPAPPPDGQAMAGSSPTGLSVAPGMPSPGQMFGPSDITPSGFMSPDASTYQAAFKQSELDRVKFQQDYKVKLDTWQWLEKNDPVLKDMSPEEKKLEHARFMYNMVTPVSYLKNEEAKDQLTYGQMVDEANQLGLPLPAGAKPGGTFRRLQNLGKTVKYESAEPLAPIATGVVSNTASPTGYSKDFVTRNDPQTPVATFNTPPPFAQATTETNREDVVSLADGTVIKVPLSSFHGPVGKVPTPGANGNTFNPSAPVTKDNLPPGAEVIGSKNVPDFIPKMEGNRNAMLNTAELADRVKDNLSVLNNMVDAGKISFSISSDTGDLVVSRLLPLNESEKQVAADTTSLAEHINTLRGPLGATGFRGAEAFSALQGQRGNLFANPEITSKVLDNTLKALIGQISSENKSLMPAGRAFPAYYKPLVLKLYKQYYGAQGVQKLRDDGY